MNSKPNQVIPTDPLFSYQWYLLNTGQTSGGIVGFDTNVTKVWPDYTGRGILVAVGDDGFDESHPDLAGNYRANLAWDFSLNTPGASSISDEDNHGTPVAGLISSLANNGIGGVGVAWGSELIGYRMNLGEDATNDQISSNFNEAALKIIDNGASVFSNSWGVMSSPFDAQLIQTSLVNTTKNLATKGRSGLGVITLFASGNDREINFNTNYDPTNNSPYTINVAASRSDGQITSYSTPGASVLIASPGSDPSSIVSTDRQGTQGYNTESGENGNYTNTSESYFNGTSAATPIAAGVVALILDANPNLGYRDVQEILVYSSKREMFLNQPGVETTFNRSTNWNGGGLLTGYDFGFGNIDALAAVRLAESWQKQSTVSNLQIIDGTIEKRQLVLDAGVTGITTAKFDSNSRVEQIMVSLDLSTNRLQDLKIELISPNGTSSTYLNYPPEVDGAVLPSSLTYTFNTVRNWGENIKGDWTLRLINNETGSPIILNDWSIQAHAASISNDHSQIFTNEFSTFVTQDSNRLILSSANGNTINASAVSAASRLDLVGGSSHIGGTPVSLVDFHAFKTIIAGDGNDILIGNTLNNLLMAGRGSNDINGGDGIDTLVVSGLPSQYSFSGNTLTGVDGALTGVDGVDTLTSIESIRFGSSLGNDLFVSDLMPSQLVDPDGSDARLSPVNELIKSFSVLYIAYFNRSPDIEGLMYWFKELNSGNQSLSQVSAGFTKSPEYSKAYPAGSSNREFITQIYKNLFDRAPDAGGLNFWENTLNAGSPRDVFINTVINGAYAPTGGAGDRALLDNKHAVSLHYTEKLSSFPTEAFDMGISTLLNRVTSNQATVNQGLAVIDHVMDNPITLTGLISDAQAFNAYW